MYRCCIFDLDGTLINTVSALTHTMNLTLAACGLGSIDEEHTKVFVGDGALNFVKRALVFCKDTELVHLAEASRTYDMLFQEHSLHGIEVYDGIRELLESLKERGMKLAVVTNKAHERAVENLNRMFGRGYFDLITGEQEGTSRKPDPAGVLRTAELLGMKPCECLYFGDTDTDMKTGIHAAMDTVGVTWGFRSREELLAYRPKYLVDAPRDVMEILKEEQMK